MKNGHLPVKERGRDETKDELFCEIKEIIEEARSSVARSVNSTLVMMYWTIGKRINEEILRNDRADYGEKIVSTVSRQLVEEFGRGFSERNIFNMIRFSEMITQKRIVQTLSAKLSWSHFIEIMKVDNPMARDFYIEMCKIENWSVRTLRDRIDSMLFERTAISKKPEELIRKELDDLRDKGRMSPDLVFRSPYFLDFLDLKDKYFEKDMESAILTELERFLLEIGTDFTFVARQKRITVGKDDFYLDLLFYHRRMMRLVAIELKLGRFTPANKGQMELYLRWLDENEKRRREKAPIGLILCTEHDDEQIRLLRLDRGVIRVTDYLTQLPPKPLLEEKLNKAIRIAKERFYKTIRIDD